MVACKGCDQENPDGARFCLACGSPLGGSEARRTEERRFVTVFFADIVGFTTRSDGADPEDVRDILIPFHERAKSVIERFGGSLDKFIGDAVLGVFGAPVAHEDDPERAISAALAILDAVEKWNAENPEPHLALRIGIESGEVVAAFASGPVIGETVAGDCVNTASRLQGTTEPGTMVVGEGTYRAAIDTFDFDELEPIAVKGKAQPLRRWRPTGTRTHATLDLRGDPGPFVGREDESGTLSAALAEAVGGGARHLAILGEPGVGKSRLVAEWLSTVEAGSTPARWLAGSCLPYGDGVTYWALGEMAKSQAGILDSDDPDTALGKLDLAVKTAGVAPAERRWMTAHLATLTGAASPAGPRPDASTAPAAWLAFLIAVSADQPLVLVFEDVHWADNALLDLIEALAEVDEPILVVSTARPEILDARPTWGQDARSLVVRLEALTREQTAELAASLLGGALSPAVEELLAEKAGGNPLFAEQIVGILTDRDETLEHEGVPGTTVEIPATIRGLIAARLDLLPEASRQVGQDASVVGRVFWSGALVAMDHDEDDLRLQLHDLRRRDLIRASTSGRMAQETEHRFTHGLVRDVAYSQIPRAQRAAKHRAAAEWIGAAGRGRLDDVADFLAYHYTEALRLTRAFGSPADAEALRVPALRFLTMAGDRAMTHDVPQALAFFRRARDLVSPAEAEWLPLLVRYAEAASAAGRGEEARSAFREARDGFLAAEDHTNAGDALVGLAVDLQFQGRSEEAERSLAEAIELLAPQAPSVALLRAYCMTAMLAGMDSRSQECIAFAEMALDLTERMDAPEVARYRAQALQYRGWGRCGLGDERGLADLQDALERCISLGLGRETVYAYNDLGASRSNMHGSGAGTEVLREAVAFAERRGLVVDSMFVRANLIHVLTVSERWDRLLEDIEGFRVLEAQHGEGYAGAMLWWLELTLLAAVGRVREAVEAIPEAESRARAADLQVLAPALAAGATALMAAGNRDAARSRLAEAERITRGAGAIRIWLVRPGADVFVELGHAEGLTELLEGLGEIDDFSRFAVGYGRAALAEIDQRLQDAAEGFGDAAKRADALGAPADAAAARMGRGRCLARLGRSDEAAGEFRSARAAFEGFGAGRLVAGCDAALAGLTRRGNP